MTRYAQGGLTRFDTGGTHESSPIGGIPIGGNNSVEENETKNGNFVYSNRIFLDNNIVSQYNLPKSLIGKSVADATKFIDNKFKGRNDKISQSTKNGMLSKIAEAQEAMKPQEPEMMQQEGIDPQMVGNVPQLGQMAWGGDTSENSAMSENIGGAGGGLSGFTSNPVVGAVAGGLGEIGQAMFQENSKNLGYSPKEQAIQSGWEKGKDAVGNALPIAGLFRNVEKLGKGLGQSIGGDKGGDFANGFLDPMQNVFSKDTNFGEKALSVLDPVVSGLIMQRKNEARRVEEGNKNAINLNKQFSDTYAYGGQVKPRFKPRPLQTSVNTLTPVGIQQPVFETPTASTVIKNYEQFSEPKPSFGKQVWDNTKVAGKFVNDNLGNIARYAPVAANAYQLSQLEKPQYESLARLGNRYQPEYVDEAQLQNIAKQSMNNSVNAISQSGASQGQIRASILGSQLQRTKALSDSYSQAAAQNRATNDRAQQFNLGVDQVNLQQSNSELDINDRNKGNYDTQKSKLISQLGNDVGNIGKEQVQKKIIAKTTGYAWDGEYVKSPDGNVVTDPDTGKPMTGEKWKALQSSKEKKALGGYLIKNKLK